MSSILSLINKNGLLSLCLVVANVVFAQNSNKTIVDASCDLKAVIATPSSLSCNVRSVVLDGSASSSGPNFTYQWTILGVGYITFGENTKIATALAAGTYQLTVTDEKTGCSAFKSVRVNADSVKPIAYKPNDIERCDLNNDGFGSFILTITTAEIINNQSDVSVTYHETEAEALANINSLPTEYINRRANSQVIYARVTNSNGCFDITTFKLTLWDMPKITSYIDYIVCDNDYDGMQKFDLEDIKNEIFIPLKDKEYTFDYFMSHVDAENGNNPIADHANFTNTIPFQQTLWAKSTYTKSGCYWISPLTLGVVPLPIINTPVTYELCDLNNTGDEIEIFDLTSKVDEITIQEHNLEISFHENIDDAYVGLNYITNPKSYVNTVLGGAVQTLFVRLVNRLTACSSIGILDLRVNINASNECNLSSPKFDFESQFSLYPNPVIDVLHIQSKGDSVIDSVAIYNYMGQLVLTTKPTALGVDVSGLSKGVYVLKATTNNGTTVTRFIKE